ncbi:Uncharacterized protein OS=Desulfomicrobium baculatum (strain DSM 4028 / VKM B-1378) GN=Dbac_0494 PE=4 SV=1 [Gemmataceae bacterium]|nr:Uncharacterized protein OS=Desulfomicrobium baculatum (strain DSM 4028 / VKM B-1378) GN=Dbac_0494 PE=4 SV=1 [Gemmataceae bacterium]VTU01456.1 Uncharacterized protein OS=Desulfomicrobium baculatum (strain DSM 4028 / VKM B-1378) GN=Dbac_0494 PE=4 SV=1 [Gemmataceae bacterium]
MRLTLAVLLATVVAGCSRKHDDHNSSGHSDAKGGGHEDDHGGHGDHRPSMTAMEVRPLGEVKAGQPAELELTIAGGSGQPLKDFAVVHEAKVHLILIREGLDQFAHLHLTPDPATGVLKAKHTFPLGGTYHLFADHQPSGKPAATAVAQIKIAGESPIAPPLKPDVPGTVVGDGLTAKVAIDGAKPGQEAMVRFELVNASGQPVIDLEPYMGATGHLVVVSADVTRYVHAHPADGHAGAKNVVAFGATFPQGGMYKGWGQFKRDGHVRVVPFVVQIP